MKMYGTQSKLRSRSHQASLFPRNSLNTGCKYQTWLWRKNCADATNPVWFQVAIMLREGDTSTTDIPKCLGPRSEMEART